MRDKFRTDPDLARIEFLLRQSNYAEAKAYLSQRVDQFPVDRKARLYLLLVNVNILGPQPFEQEIDGLREFSDFDESEKNIVRRIFLAGYRFAEKTGQEKQTWAYQRLLRRLLLGQPLDQPIPKSSPSALLSPDHTRLEFVPPMHVEAANSEGASVAYRRHRRFLRPPLMPRPITRMTVMAVACGLMTVPILYVGLWRPLRPVHPTVSASHQAPHPGKKAMVAEAPGLAPSRHAHTRAREEMPPALIGSNLRRAQDRRIGNQLTGGVVLRLKVDREGRVTQVNRISSQLADDDVVNAVIREARKWKFSRGGVHDNAITLTLLFLAKETAGGMVADKKAQPSHAGTRKTARSSASAPGAPQPKNKGRRVQARQEKIQRQETAAASDTQGAAPKAAKAIGFATTKRRITLRKEPRFAAASVEQIAGGIPVRVLEVRGRWLKVKSADAKTAGFVRREFLSPVQLKN